MSSRRRIKAPGKQSAPKDGPAPHKGIKTAKTLPLARPELGRAAAVFITALLVRIVYMLQSAGNPTFKVPIIDSATYLDMSRALLQGSMDPRIFWQSFFYPLYLSAVSFSTGGSLTAVRSIQVIAGSLTCALVYLVSRELFDRRVSITAGIAAALCGPLVFFDAEILATVWAVFFGTLLLLFLVRAEKAGRKADFLLAGIAGGLAAVTRATFIPFFMAVSVYILWREYRARSGVRATAAKAMLLYAGFALFLLADAGLSSRVTGNFSALPKSGTLNLYIGNNEHRDKTLMIRPGAGWRALIREPEIKGAATDDEYREYFRSRFEEYVIMHPLDFSAGILKKSVEFISSRELPRNVDIYIFRRYSTVLSALVWKWGRFGFPFGIIFPYLVIGLITGRKQIPGSFWIFMIVYPASIILVFTASRYRAVILPAALVAASAGFWQISSMVKMRRWRTAAMAGVLAASMLVLSSAGGPYAVEKFDYGAEMHASVAFEMAKKGDMEEAAKQAEKALELSPDYAAAHRILGNILNQQGKYEEAVSHFSQALKEDPGSYTVDYYISIPLIKLGRYDEAESHLEKALTGARSAKEAGLVRNIENLLRLIRK